MDTADLTIDGVQNLLLELETLPLTEPFIMYIENAMYEIMLKPEEVTYHTYTSKEDKEEDFGMCEGMCQINKKH